jgi:hypothetical protein
VWVWVCVYARACVIDECVILCCMLCGEHFAQCFVFVVYGERAHLCDQEVRRCNREIYIYIHVKK